ncbi:hypothetical protein VOLCADRAFT_104110 [Volvox carteri f. nagariensis]|uniref:Uncharacterized protein n=1 Tax=Volvox carteri f. nagariensis TaxID=3068 RepID=D8TRA7_VOLCA|nr:uncharacterized protein VOLCADRAFT_104110 [Volvox carteri f. nagariensis]XP_002959775.1 uncharacterized protein VOLCADRAFT_101294 [Volvox carteri f. nagariensis]EFJ39160.1 hypothetical protein VOLCADRAFT_101294 [Volvox carteri f. nagariensis]EFJ49962.1 hypothetical protein VOLCADRAFT_104110 [Volvox carteri f. nagariensis]|eukprot:XP_002949027.1 hypothetical protein VOLCADRAFT_104110 [Volvox carteri f. nagariensis]
MDVAAVTAMLRYNFPSWFDWSEDPMKPDQGQKGRSYKVGDVLATNGATVGRQGDSHLKDNVTSGYVRLLLADIRGAGCQAGALWLGTLFTLTTPCSNNNMRFVTADPKQCPVHQHNTVAVKLALSVQLVRPRRTDITGLNALCYCNETWKKSTRLRVS